MRRLIFSVLPLLLLLVITTPAAAFTSYSIDNLQVRPKVARFGEIVIGSCDLSTFEGCEVKTITFTNTGSKPIKISGYGVLSPSGDVGLDPQPSQSSDCSRLPGRLWTLTRGRSCTIRVGMAPTTVGRVERRLQVWGSGGQFDVIAIVPLRTVGVEP